MGNFGEHAPPPLEVVEEGKHIDLYGTPDWVCEVVSDSSVKKDTKRLRQAYHKAGIPEYWLIDARGEEIDFRILVWQEGGYVEAEDIDGWRRSPVFDCQFQLTRSRNRVGNWRYDLSRR
ncbi:MAG: Uma2 family endonuclease [Planctomycetes bacterium]|nr:Uma2 family endonuclease [Planctomycetota bacterium]